MGFLEVAAANVLSGDMRRDSEHGHPTSIRIEQAVDEVEVARPAAPRYNGEVARDRGFC